MLIQAYEEGEAMVGDLKVTTFHRSTGLYGLEIKLSGASGRMAGDTHRRRRRPLYNGTSRAPIIAHREENRS